MEAMALGLPVISTNVGGIPYLLTHNQTAILVNANDVDQMTTSIVDLIANPNEAIKLAKNARMLTEKMDWDMVKQDWFLLLN